MVHVVIAEATNPGHENRIWMKRGVIAQRARCSEKTVSRAFQKMVKAGHLKVIEGGGGRGKATVYEMLLPGHDVPVTDPNTGTSATIKPGHDVPVVSPETGTFDALNRDIDDLHLYRPDIQQPEVITTCVEKSTPVEKKLRPRDELFDSLISVLELDTSELTTSARGPLNRALKDLRSVGATPDEIRLRAGRWSEHFPGATLTGPALAKHWPMLARPSPTRTTTGRPVGRRTAANQAIFREMREAAINDRQRDSSSVDLVPGDLAQLPPGRRP